jgi:hypothetical protein
VSRTRLTGTYMLGLEPVFVFERDGDLMVSGAGVPAEYASRLVSDGNAFRVEGGELEGARVVFADGDPCPGGTLAGVLELRRAPDDVSIPGGRGLAAPSLVLTREEEAAYGALLNAILRDRDGAFLDPGEGPRWRFVEWLTGQNAVIFHGSPKPDIEVFVPVRTSVELMDHRGTGNLAAVYGTPSGLWAMWFAVLDRDRLEGSIRNGVVRWTDRTGRALDLYHFSVHHEYVGGDIWRPGTLYLLPRETFRANPLFPGGPGSSEWASTEEVGPLKRIAVDPEDFPFREQVGGHDDSELIRSGELSDLVLDRARGARRIPNAGIELTFDWDDGVASVFDEYLALAGKYTPDVDRRLVSNAAGVAVLEVRGPAGYLQSFEHALRKRGVVMGKLSGRGRVSRSGR